MNETLQFGLTMLVVGMGGTILMLLGLAGMIRVLTRIFPPERKVADSKAGQEAAL